MTQLRIWSWICIFASPLVIVFFGLSSSIFFGNNGGCSGWGCLAWVLEIAVLFFIYLIFLLIGIILNVIDFMKIRKIASALRKFEVIVFTAPIWLWIFAIPHLIENQIKKNKIDALEPYIQTLENHETTTYDELTTAIAMVNNTDSEIQNNFPNLYLDLQDAQRRVNQINFINQNKQRQFPADFSLKPFQLCISDTGLIASNEPWRLTFYKEEKEFNELNVLADAEELISGETDNKGCSKVTDTSLLTPAIRNGKTLLFVIGSRLTFVDIELSNQTLTTQPQISNYDFEIDIQPLNK